VVKAIPAITDREQQHLIKEAMIDYFIANKYYSESEDNTQYTSGV
jgi:hypothetical protein